MRRRAKIDSNHPLIVRQLRQIGCSVLSLAPMGDGCPDLLVGIGGANFLFEVKDPERKPSERSLTPDEQEFFAAWRGQVQVIETFDEAAARILCFSSTKAT